MEYETLKIERDGALMVVRFNRPEKKNAINRQMHLELQAVCREVGDARALELTITCDRFSAAKAHEYGLVTHISPDGDEEKTARGLAENILAKPPLPVALTKATMKSLKRGSEMGDAVYSDADLLLYSRLMAQRRRRLEQEGRA